MRCLGTCPGACSESASELGIKPGSPGTKLQNQFSLQDVNPSSAGLPMELVPVRLPQALVRLRAAGSGWPVPPLLPKRCNWCISPPELPAFLQGLAQCPRTYPVCTAILWAVWDPGRGKPCTCCQHLNSAFLLLNVSQTGEGSAPRSDYHCEINPLLG